MLLVENFITGLQQSTLISLISGLIPGALVYFLIRVLNTMMIILEYDMQELKHKNADR